MSANESCWKPRTHENTKFFEFSSWFRGPDVISLCEKSVGSGNDDFRSLRQLINDDDAEREDRERPERIRRNRQQDPDRVERRDDDAEPPPEFTTVPERICGDPFTDAEDQRKPPP